MKLQRSKNAARNIVYGMLLKIYQIGVPFIMRTIMIYYLGAEYLGLNSLFSSVLQVLNLAELGVGSAMIFSMYKPIAEDDTTKLCALLNLYRLYYRVIGAIVCVCGLIIVPFLPYLISGSIPADLNLYVLYLLNLSATVLTYWLYSYKSSLLQAYQRTDLISKSYIITDTLKYVFQLLALTAFRSFYLYCIILLISQIMNNLLTAYYSRKYYPNIKPMNWIDKKERKIINKKIKDLFTVKIATTLLSSGDTLVISSFLGLTTLAIYQNYFYLISAVLSCFVIVHTAITAGIGNSLIVDGLEKIKKTFNTLFFAILWLLTFCTGCFLCLMQPFMKLWVGSQLMLDDSIVILLVLYFCVYELVQFFSVYKEAAGIWHQDRFRPLICSVINVILNLILVKKLGIYGVVFATVISSGFISLPWVVHNVFNYILKERPIKYLFRFCPYIIVGIGINAFLWFFVTLINLPSIWELMLKGFICGIFINFVWIISFRKTQEFCDLKNLLTRSLGRKNYESKK